MGLLAVAILVANNLRDIPTDRVAGKRTLAVRPGDSGTRKLFVALFMAASLCIVAVSVIAGPWTLLGLAGVVAAAPAMGAVRDGALGPALVPVLGAVGRAQLVLGAFFSAGILLALA